MHVQTAEIGTVSSFTTKKMFGISAGWLRRSIETFLENITTACVSITWTNADTFSVIILLYQASKRKPTSMEPSITLLGSLFIPSELKGVMNLISLWYVSKLWSRGGSSRIYRESWFHSHSSWAGWSKYQGLAYRKSFLDVSKDQQVDEVNDLPIYFYYSSKL